MEAVAFVKLCCASFPQKTMWSTNIVDVSASRQDDVRFLRMLSSIQDRKE